jgi:precorrin-3B C17-methyltransferase
MRTSCINGDKERQINRAETEYGSNNCSCSIGQLPLVSKLQPGDKLPQVGEHPLAGECQLVGERQQVGDLTVVGSGPGGVDLMTPWAKSKISAADLVIGYETYLQLISELINDKKVLSYRMTEEVERAKAAIDYTKQGLKVVVISGGDPGVYGMAGPLLELAAAEGLAIEVVPGVTAATAAASRLGAPLMHDFAVISLSDRLTPWEKIQKRIELASEADLVLVIYNPRSQGRINLIFQAREIVLKYRTPQTPVGIVAGAFREDETVIISDLQHFLDFGIDMSTTVIIGNSQTKITGARMVTPRGYQL